MADVCPKCGSELNLGDINIDQGVALCRACGRLSSLSEVVKTAVPVDHLIDDPPKGCTLIDYGRDVQILVSLRSIRRMLMTAFVMMFWNGITSIFVLGALASLVFGGSSGESSDFPLPTMPRGIAVGVLLFMIPFILIGLSLIAAFLLAIGGHLDIRLAHNEGSIRTALGPFGWTRRFNPADIQNVAIHMHSGENGTTPDGLVLEGKRTIRFGSGLPEDRRDWLRAILLHLLVHNRERFASDH